MHPCHAGAPTPSTKQPVSLWGGSTCLARQSGFDVREGVSESVREIHCQGWVSVHPFNSRTANVGIMCCSVWILFYNLLFFHMTLTLHYAKPSVCHGLYRPRHDKQYLGCRSMAAFQIAALRVSNHIRVRGCVLLTIIVAMSRSTNEWEPRASNQAKKCVANSQPQI